MKERGIIMSAPMVLACLLVVDPKWQTRRLRGLERVNALPDHWKPIRHTEDPARWSFKAGPLVDVIRCPYGVPGDRLWVRETFRPMWGGEGAGGKYVYRAGDRSGPGAPRWTPAIHMPRAACRLVLELLDVRAERLQEITERDAIAEGIERDRDGWKSYEVIHQGRHRGEPHPHAVAPNRSPIRSYRELWESLNGPRSWECNPWVWVLSFRRI